MLPFEELRSTFALLLSKYVFQLNKLVEIDEIVCVLAIIGRNGINMLEVMVFAKVLLKNCTNINTSTKFRKEQVTKYENQ